MHLAAAEALEPRKLLSATPVDQPTTADDTFSAINTGLPMQLDVLHNDTGTDLRLHSITQPAGGTVSIDHDDQLITFTPFSNRQTATASFSYTVIDGSGAEATADVQLTLSADGAEGASAHNNIPTTEADVASTAAGQPALINVLSNDRDLDGDEISLVSVGNADHGTVIRRADVSDEIWQDWQDHSQSSTESFDDWYQASHGPTDDLTWVVEYTPDDGFTGTDSFSYLMQDEHGAQRMGTVSVTTITLPDAPDTVNDAFTLKINTATRLDVLANDTATGDTPFSIVDPGTAANGRVELADDGSQQLIYTPDDDFTGADSFTYTVEDRYGTQNTATVTVLVEATVADAVNDTFTSINRGQPIRLNVLTNDEGDNLQITGLTQPTDGQVAVNAESGQIEFTTPDSDWAGSTSFTYSVTNAEGIEDTATVSLTVVAEQQIAFTISGPAEVNDGESAVFTISYDGTLADGETASVRVFQRLDETSPVDFLGTLGSALSDAELSAKGVTVKGTTVVFIGGADHDSSFSFTLTLRDDSDFEQPESFRIEIGQATASTGLPTLAAATARTTIRDNDGRIVFALTQDSEEPVSEEAGQRTATYTVRYSGPLADGETAGVNIIHHLHDTTEGDYTEGLPQALQTAVAGATGITLDGTRVLFHGGAASDTSLTFSLMSEDDGAIEGPESFQIELSDPDTTIGGTADVDAAAGSITTTIADDDNRIEFSLTGSQSVTEDTTDADLNSASYTISYSGDLFPGESTSVDILHRLNDTRQADYTVALKAAIYSAASDSRHIDFDGTTLTFHRPADSDIVPVTELQFSLQIADDGLAEGEESFSIELQNAKTTSGGTAEIAVSSVSTSIVSNNPVLSVSQQHVTSLSENEALPTDLHVADLSIDDSLGVIRLKLTGDGADLFKLVGSSLFLKAGTALDYEGNPSLDVTVHIDDPLLADDPNASVSVSVAIDDVTLSAVDDVLKAGNTSRGEAVELDVLANDFSDANGHLTIISITGATGGSLQIQSAAGDDDTVTYTADYGFAGSEELTYVVEDAEGNQATAQVSLTIFTTADANRAPIVDTIHVSTTSGAPQTFQVLDTLFDPDGDSLTLVSIGEPGERGHVYWYHDTPRMGPGVSGLGHSE